MRRLVRRRVGDEQRVVAEALGDAALDVLFALLDRDDLRGAGLAGVRIGRAGESARAGAFLVHADHRVLD